MHRFFINREQLNRSPVIITGEDYNHIKNVLRLKPGDAVSLSDGTDREYECCIEGFDEEKAAVFLKVVDICSISRELPVKITLFQGYPKGDKIETVVQKAVELGIYEVVPVMMKRCVVRLDEKKALKKVERLNTIALNAAKQAKRGIIPQVTEVMQFNDALKYVKGMDYILLPYENAEGMDYARWVVAQAKGKTDIGIFVGPEGGFEKDEVDALESVGAKAFSLGHRVLRTETAGMAVLSLLMFLLEEDNLTGD